MTSKEQRKQWEAEQKTLALLRVEEDDLDWSCHIVAIKINSSSINSSINSPFFLNSTSHPIPQQASCSSLGDEVKPQTLQG